MRMILILLRDTLVLYGLLFCGLGAWAAISGGPAQAPAWMIAAAPFLALLKTEALIWRRGDSRKSEGR